MAVLITARKDSALAKGLERTAATANMAVGAMPTSPMKRPEAPRPVRTSSAIGGNALTGLRRLELVSSTASAAMIATADGTRRFALAALDILVILFTPGSF